MKLKSIFVNFLKSDSSTLREIYRPNSKFKFYLEILDMVIV
jgi:hypothetical protein